VKRQRRRVGGVAFASDRCQICVLAGQRWKELIRRSAIRGNNGLTDALSTMDTIPERFPDGLEERVGELV
jgi:hypothetical protein